jgi:hypothetical protein
MTSQPFHLSKRVEHPRALLLCARGAENRFSPRHRLVVRSSAFARSAITLALLGGAALAADPPTKVSVGKDGSIVSPANAATARFINAESDSRTVRYEFGLPSTPPSERWREADTPILQTLWETGGVKYTQKVLVTRLDQGDPPVSASAEEAVLMVQVFGQCVAAEYTNAAASFSVRAADRPLNLELNGDQILLLGGKEPVFLGVLDVAGSGVAGTNGPQLRFQGNMPPGTSGAMTFKLPQRALAGNEHLNQLRDLDFDEEFQRVKKFWKNQTGPAARPPVVWAEEKKP